MKILDLIKQYPLTANGTIDPKAGVNLSYLRTVLNTEVAACKSDNEIVKPATESNHLDWVVEILTAYPDTFLPGYIREQISPNNPELAYWLYTHAGVKSHLKSKEQDSVLLIACQVQDKVMVEYCLTQPSEKTKINRDKKHLPALFATIDNEDALLAQILLNAEGTDVNVKGGEEETMSAAHRAIMNNNLDILRFLSSRKGFNWNTLSPEYGSLLRCACTMYSRAQTDPFRQKAELIFAFLLDDFKANPNPAIEAQLIQGSTTLTYAIVNARPCAGRLIKEGMGVFDSDMGPSALLCFGQVINMIKHLRVTSRPVTKQTCRRLWPSSSMQTLE